MLDIWWMSRCGAWLRLSLEFPLCREKQDDEQSVEGNCKGVLNEGSVSFPVILRHIETTMQNGTESSRITICRMLEKDVRR